MNIPNLETFDMCQNASLKLKHIIYRSLGLSFFMLPVVYHYSVDLEIYRVFGVLLKNMSPW